MFWLLIVSAYLLGSVPFAIILSRFSSLPDPRLCGSGNPGATNMLRVAGKRMAALTLFGDLCKGLLVVAAAIIAELPPLQQAWVGLAAVIGHLYPVFFRFKGGKGVATAAGAMLGINPLAALLAIASWITTFGLTRTSSLAALAALPLSLPIVAWQQPATLLPFGLIGTLIIWRHRRNLLHLIMGTERRF